MRPAEIMARFIQGSPRISHKSPVVLKAPSPGPFCDICTDTVRGAHELLPNRILGEIIPSAYNSPYFIRQFFGELINNKIFKI